MWWKIGLALIGGIALGILACLAWFLWAFRDLYR